MSSNDYVDANALLQILSAYAPLNQNAPIPVSSSTGQYPIDDFKRGEVSAGYDPTMPALGLPVTHFPVAEQLSSSMSRSQTSFNAQPSPFNSGAIGAEQRFDHAQSIQSFDQPSTPVVQKQDSLAQDPRTITDWPTALRYVTKLAAKNVELGNSIRKLIANQHDNEQQWWASRQALVQKQAARIEGKRKLDEVLRSVGALTAPPITAADDTAELRQFDLKVHRAQSKMCETIASYLATLEIPFFGIKQELISVEDEVLRTEIFAAPEKSTQQKKTEQLTQSRLAELRQKMIQHLEDLYND